MTECAARLVSDVLPRVPVRQWVLSVPHRLRYLLAWDHSLSRAVLGVYTRVLAAIATRVERLLRRRGLAGFTASSTRTTGAWTMYQGAPVQIFDARKVVSVRSPRRRSDRRRRYATRRRRAGRPDRDQPGVCRRRPGNCGLGVREEPRAAAGRTPRQLARPVGRVRGDRTRIGVHDVILLFHAFLRRSASSSAASPIACAPPPRAVSASSVVEAAWTTMHLVVRRPMLSARRRRLPAASG